jgi:hypothetical protein
VGCVGADQKPHEWRKAEVGAKRLFIFSPLEKELFFKRKIYITPPEGLCTSE